MKKLYSRGELAAVLIPAIVFGFGVGGMFVMGNKEKVCAPDLAKPSCSQTEAIVYGQCTEVFPFCKAQCLDEGTYTTSIDNSCLRECLETYRKPSY